MNFYALLNRPLKNSSSLMSYAKLRSRRYQRMLLGSVGSYARSILCAAQYGAAPSARQHALSRAADSFECWNQLSDRLRDGVMYCCVHLMDGHIGNVGSSPHKGPRMDYLLFKEKRNRDEEMGWLSSTESGTVAGRLRRVTVGPVPGAPCSLIRRIAEIL
jgi:hypothetical protein